MAIFFIIIRNTIGSSEKENSVFQKIFLGIYLGLICLFTLTQIGAAYNYYLRGYRSTSMVFLLMTSCGIIYWLFDRKKILTNVFRAFLFCFSILAIAAAPFVIILVAVDRDKQHIYNDEKYRLETNHGFLAPCKLPDLYEKNGIIERHFGLKDSTIYLCLTRKDIAAVKTKSLPDKQVRVTYLLSAKRAYNLPDSISVTYCEK